VPAVDVRYQVIQHRLLGERDATGSKLGDERVVGRVLVPRWSK
jgi:hypothetical protein